MVVEGVNTVQVACSLAEKYNVELPIVAAVNAVVNGGASAREQVHALMHREQKAE